MAQTGEKLKLRLAGPRECELEEQTSKGTTKAKGHKDFPYGPCITKGFSESEKQDEKEFSATNGSSGSSIEISLSKEFPQ